MKKQNKNTDKKYYIVVAKIPTLTEEVEKGKRNKKDKDLVMTVMGIYKTANTANKWARIIKNDIIQYFNKAYKAHWWSKYENEDGTECYAVKFKKHKQIFEVCVFEEKIGKPPEKGLYELNLYFDNELEDEEKIENVENYLHNQAKELEKFEEDEE